MAENYLASNPTPRLASGYANTATTSKASVILGPVPGQDFVNGTRGLVEAAAKPTVVPVPNCGATLAFLSGLVISAASSDPSQWTTLKLPKSEVRYPLQGRVWTLSRTEPSQGRVDVRLVRKSTLGMRR